jgi:hypothetical protein
MNTEQLIQQLKEKSHLWMRDANTSYKNGYQQALEDLKALLPPLTHPMDGYEDQYKDEREYDEGDHESPSIGEPIGPDDEMNDETKYDH